MTCFSCARLLECKDYADPLFSALHFPTCQRNLASKADKLLDPSLHQLPMGMAQVFLPLASAANSESRAHNLYAFLIVTTGIDISIINTVSLLGPSATSILKGIANYFFPHFLPTSTASASKLDVHKTLRLHLLVAIFTSLSTCLVTTYFHRREDKTMQDYVSFTIGHWVVISLNLAVLLVHSCLNLFAKQS